MTPRKTEYESDVRTLPTGVGTENSDYYDTAYRIYTGAGDNATNYGSYERLKNSTVTSRRQAYDKFLSNLRRNNLLLAGENTNDIETLSYFQIERKSAYEDALVRKLSDTFTAEAVAKITEEWCNEQFANALRNQTDNFKNNPSALKTALDGVSDTSFVLTSPDNLNYGFVYNILLPFSAKQEEELADADQQVRNARPPFKQRDRDRLARKLVYGRNRPFVYGAERAERLHGRQRKQNAFVLRGRITGRKRQIRTHK